MRNLLVYGALVAAASAAAPAFAQDVTVTGNVALVSDYQWRNVTQSNYDATIQGGFDVTASSGFYAGVWASGVDFGNPSDSNLEVDLYGGFRFDLGGVATDVGVIHYAYPDSTSDINFTEAYAKFSKGFDALTLSGSVNWDPDNETIYADVGAAYKIVDGFSVNGGYGTYLDGFGEYAGWNVGGVYSASGLDFGVKYYDSDIAGADSQVVFSIGKVL